MADNPAGKSGFNINIMVVNEHEVLSGGRNRGIYRNPTIHKR